MSNAPVSGLGAPDAPPPKPQPAALPDDVHGLVPETGEANRPRRLAPRSADRTTLRSNMREVQAHPAAVLLNHHRVGQ